ncbi:hypothetical protein ABG067_009075, partial [Albugo candida]
MHGGLGLGMDAQAMLYQELGRAVAPLPYLATSLAADAIARAGDVAQQTAWLPQIAGGMRAAASAPATLVPPTLRLSQAQGAWVLSGRGAFLPDAVDATLLVLLAQDAEGTWWRICVEPAADGVEVRSRPTWDRTRTLAE